MHGKNLKLYRRIKNLIAIIYKIDPFNNYVIYSIGPKLDFHLTPQQPSLVSFRNKGRIKVQLINGKT